MYPPQRSKTLHHWYLQISFLYWWILCILWKWAPGTVAWYNTEKWLYLCCMHVLREIKVTLCDHVGIILDKGEGKVIATWDIQETRYCGFLQWKGHCSCWPQCIRIWHITNLFISRANTVTLIFKLHIKTQVTSNTWHTMHNLICINFTLSAHKYNEIHINI